MESRGKDAPSIFISAGEASGDLHASRVVRALKALDPSARITCMGGSNLRAAGAEVLVDNRELSVVGLFEVFRHARAILAGWRKIKSHLTRERPDVVVLVDFPDFNFLLGRAAAKLGIKIFYYISPQVWAWRTGRVRTLKRLANEMAVILPFETEFYRRRGMDVHYVGHPLLDVMESAPSVREARERYGSDSSSPVVGILPGSRHGEIRLLLPLLLETASRLREEIPGISFLLPVAPTLDSEEIRKAAEARRLPIRLVEGDAYGVIRACDLLLTVSGTVTLEAAILGVPMIVVYKVSNLSYYTGRHLIKVKYVGLPNLIAGRSIVPELLQLDANPDRLTAEALSFLKKPERLAEQHRELEKIQAHLGNSGVADRTAKLILEVLER